MIRLENSMAEYHAAGLYLEETPTMATPSDGAASLPVRVIIDKHIVAGTSRIGPFGWSAIATQSASRPQTRSPEFESVILKRDLTYDSVFDAWMQAASRSPHQIRKTMIVELLDKQGHVTARWRFRNAWPRQFRIMPVRGKPAPVELVTIEHEGVERDPDVRTRVIEEQLEDMSGTTVATEPITNEHESIECASNVGAAE
jgi:hypothetical protein